MRFPGQPPEQALGTPDARASAQAISDQLVELRVRCRRQTGSFMTPMGDEMFYRYQESLINEATTTLAMLLRRMPSQHGAAPS